MLAVKSASNTAVDQQATSSTAVQDSIDGTGAAAAAAASVVLNFLGNTGDHQHGNLGVVGIVGNNGFEYNNRAQELVNMEQPSTLLIVARRVNSFWLTGVVNTCTPLIVDGYRIGLIMPNVLEQILEDNLNPPTSLPMPVFRIADKYVEFADCVAQTYLGRSEAIQAMLRDWRQRGLFIALRGWREECFEVACHFDDPNLFRMERSATFLFGIRKYGVDINGYVRHPLHGICIWLQKRAVTKQTWPDKWDNIVGGGLSTGYTVLDTACKEAQEEATIPMELLKNNLKPVGTVSYFFNNDRGLSPNTEFVFDLELPLNFKPSNSDGEVDEFNLVTAEEALRIACGPDFKTTSCPVIIDFMIRHGLITEESEPNLLEVKKLFNVPLETFYYRERKSDVPSP